MSVILILFLAFTSLLSFSGAYRQVTTRPPDFSSGRIDHFSHLDMPIAFQGFGRGGSIQVDDKNQQVHMVVR